MKTHHIVSAFRNASSPAARLAAWQDSPLARRRRMVTPFADPELSSPAAETPLLWSTLTGPEILETFAGRIALDHRGWFTDEFQDETLETYAVRLVRFPRLMFYAVLGSSCPGDLRIDLSEWSEIDYDGATSDYSAADAVSDAARAMIRSCDSSTAREAEEAQEYYRKDRVEQDMADNRETLAGLRHDIRQLVHELKTLCPSPMATTYPAAAHGLRTHLAHLLSDRRELMVTNSKLAASL